MKKTFFAESALLAALSVVLILLIDPYNIMMKLMLSGAVLVVLVVLYTVKFIVIFREKPQDERDLAHRFRSSGVSYYTVSILLFIGVLVESLTGDIDSWLVVSLAGLFVSKLVSMVYLEIYK